MTQLRLAFALPLLAYAFACSPGSQPDAGLTENDGGANENDGGVAADAGSEDDGCRVPGDCGPYDTGAADCAVPDAIAFPASVCGACLTEPDQCADDAECGAGFVCRREGACGCGVAAAICVDGCTSNADCLTGQDCDADSHCVATTCSDASDCPDQFSCDAQQCARLDCSDDAGCDDGFCVQGLCFDELGGCFENIPVP